MDTVCRVAQSELWKILRFQGVAQKFTRLARHAASLESIKGSGGGGAVAEPSNKTKSVDSSKNQLFVRRKRRPGGGAVAEPSKNKSIDSSIDFFFVD